MTVWKEASLRSNAGNGKRDVTTPVPGQFQEDCWDIKEEERSSVRRAPSGHGSNDQHSLQPVHLRYLDAESVKGIFAMLLVDFAYVQEGPRVPVAWLPFVRLAHPWCDLHRTSSHSRRQIVSGWDRLFTQSGKVQAEWISSSACSYRALFSVLNSVTRARKTMRRAWIDAVITRWAFLTKKPRTISHCSLMEDPSRCLPAIPKMRRAGRKFSIT